LEVGDRVWQDAQKILTMQPSTKLNWKCIGPFEVTEIINLSAYLIKLPSPLLIHDIQPISQFESAA
jgi:hypothetical protein